MSRAISFLKASDGTAAVDMAVTVVGDWVPTKIGQPISFQIANPAGVNGTWTVEGTNDDPAAYNATPSTASTGLYWSPVTQPTGTAVTTSITLQATHDNMRPKFTRSSGGTGVICAGNYGVGAGGVLVMPPDVANVPASQAAALSALAADATALGLLADDQTALSSLADDQVSLTAVAADATPLGLLADDQVALTAIAADQTELSALADDQTELSALADDQTALAALADNQTSITALATSFRNTTDLDTGAAPTAGLVYRSTGAANAVTEAQADSAANAASIIGVGDSVLGLRPLTMPGSITFDSLPVVGQIAYLSATVAGQATCAVPAVGDVDKQLGYVDRIISGVAPFGALVTPIGTSGDGYFPPEALVYYEANSATPATDMQVKIVTGWARTIPGKVVSFQFVWDGNVTGEFTLEGTNDSAPATGLDGNNDVYPAAGYAEPSQPAGAAGSTTIAAIASHAWHRGVFDPAAGGVGVTPSGNVAKG